MPKIEIVCFSGFGHTKVQAEAVLEGAKPHGDARLWMLPEDGVLPEEGWDALDAADAIVLGTPTYMAGPAWQLKRFADDSSKRWMSLKWKDKLMGGFTNSGSASGDKVTTLTWMATFGAQHGALWVPLGQPPANAKDSTAGDANWLGGALGAMAQSPVDASPEEAPHAGDMDSARTYGARIAQLASAMSGIDDGAQIAAE